MKTYQWHADPGHAWLAVPALDLARLPATVAASISTCSYRSHDSKTVYLEEDCDASVFLRGLEAAGIAYTLTEATADAGWVRNLQHYQPTAHTLRRAAGGAA